MISKAKDPVASNASGVLERISLAPRWDGICHGSQAASIELKVRIKDGWCL